MSGKASLTFPPESTSPRRCNGKPDVEVGPKEREVASRNFGTGREIELYARQ
jgi:hypothetical protein